MRSVRRSTPAPDQDRRPPIAPRSWRRGALALALAASPACFSPLGHGPATDSDGSTSSEAPTGDAPTATSDGAPTTSGPGDPDTTAAPDPCSDGARDGDETDVDCGGSCAPCEAGLECVGDDDCASAACLDDRCLADPACLDASECPAGACAQATCVDFVCGEAPAMPGAACDDGQVCTADEACAAGQCVASSPKPIALVDVPDDPSLGLFFAGTAAKDLAGGQLGAAGDFNGDGAPDLYIVGDQPQPRVYVLFGGPTLATATLAGVARGQGGVMIDVDIGSPVQVAAVGDVDNKGRDDLILGAPQSADAPLAGGVYLVTGRADTTAIALATPPAGVHLLTGPDDMLNSGFGSAVAGLGDVDGDGVPDFVVTAPQYTNANAEQVGAAFVVYGSNMLGDGAIAAYVSNGRAYRVEGPSMHGGFGLSVAGVGDFNGDKRRDLLIGQPGWEKSKGRAWVVFTPAAPTSFQLSATPDPATALALAGTTSLKDFIGTAVAAAGDFNADGFADALVSGGPLYRRALVVHGGKYGGVIEASALVADKHGSVIEAADNDTLGPAVAGGLDVNGDLVDDLVLGAPASGTSGMAFVAFGAKGVDPFTRTVSELAAGKGGFAVAGAGVASQTGASVALIASVNADERADLLIGAAGFDVQPAGDEGRAYVILGGACDG